MWRLLEKHQSKPQLLAGGPKPAQCSTLGCCSFVVVCRSRSCGFFHKPVLFKNDMCPFGVFVDRPGTLLGSILAGSEAKDRGEGGGEGGGEENGEPNRKSHS